MKKLLLTAIVAAACTAGYSQVTNTVTSVFDFIHQGSNFVVGAYTMYDDTDHSFGGGVGIGYKATPNLVPTLRLDVVHKRLFVPSVNMSLELPIAIQSTNIWFIPMTAAGVATPFNGGNTGNPIGIFGIGAAIRFDKKPLKILPDYVLWDYERWTGGGFNDNQFRGGFGWKLGKSK